MFRRLSMRTADDQSSTTCPIGYVRLLPSAYGADGQSSEPIIFANEKQPLPHNILTSTIKLNAQSRDGATIVTLLLPT